MEKHGFGETDIDRLSIETSVDTLADLENLALKHEIGREAIFREAERRREKRYDESHRADRRQNARFALSPRTCRRNLRPHRTRRYRDIAEGSKARATIRERLIKIAARVPDHRSSWESQIFCVRGFREGGSVVG
jgi:hypothetical protein